LPVGVIATVLAAGSPQPGLGEPARGQPVHTLLIFAPDIENERFAKQKNVIAAETDEFQRRKISVLYVIGRSVSSALGPDAKAIPATLRLRYRVGKHDFRAILIDKDGATEILSDVPVSAGQIYQTVDAVPAPDD
jgi:hypothetical protein